MMRPATPPRHISHFQTPSLPQDVRPPRNLNDYLGGCFRRRRNVTLGIRLKYSRPPLPRSPKINVYVSR